MSRFGKDGAISNFDFCFHPDTRIQLINGETDTIKSVCERVQRGENVYTYAINPETEQFAVTRIVAGRKTRVNSETVVVTLDTGKSVICHPEHKFMTRDGSYVQAKDLTSGTSLMRCDVFSSANYGVDYRLVGTTRNASSGQREHRMIAEYFYPENTLQDSVVHHIDGNGLNNAVSNLAVIPQSEHCRHHITEFWGSLTAEQRSEIARQNATHKRIEKLNAGQQKWWASLSDEERTAFCQNISEHAKLRVGEKNPMYGKRHSDDTKSLIGSLAHARSMKLSESDRKRIGNRMTRAKIVKFAQCLIESGESLRKETWDTLKTRYTPTWETSVPVLVESGYLQNHKVVSVVPGERSDLYNIQVESEFHNYPLADLGVVVSNCSLEIRVAAIISGDKHYCEMLQAGTDFHKATAALVFNVPIDEVTKEQRQNAKAVNFG